MCIKINKIGNQEVGIWWVQKRFPRYGVPIWSLWPNIRFLPSIVAEKNATKNVHICSMCIKINLVGKQEVGIWRVQKRYPQYGIPIWRLWPNIRFLHSYWEKCDEKYLGRTEGWKDERTDGRTDRRTEVKQYTPLPLRGARNCLWQTCLLTDRDEMIHFNRWPSIDASYQILVNLAKWFLRRRIIKKWQIRNNNCLWQPCLLTDRDEMYILYRRPPIDASYQDSVHLAKRFQRRWFLEIDQSETRIPCGGHVCYWIGTKWAIFIKDLPLMLPTTFRFIWLSSFRREYF